MKKNKIISVLLVIVMLASIMSLTASAEGKTYNATNSFVATSTYSLDPEDFNLSVNINSDKIYVLNGHSAEYTYEILYFKATYTDLTGATHSSDYNTSPEEFFAIFDKRIEDMKEAEIFNEGKPEEVHKKVSDITLSTEISISFADEGVFGILEYSVIVEGFSAPAVSTGDLGIGDALDAIKLPTDIEMSGTISEFPTIASVKVISKPVKTAYTDAEKFDATGLELEISTTDGITGAFTYNEATSFSFTFNPSIKGNLTTYDSEIITYLNGIEILKTPITVEHKWSDGYVNITTDKYTENKPGYHAIVCEGCGETHDAQPHTPKYEEWTYNNDQTFVANGTESNVCTDCGTVLIRDTFGTADFNTAFADLHFIKVIFEYINVLLRFIGAATY